MTRVPDDGDRGPEPAAVGAVARRGHQRDRGAAGGELAAAVERRPGPPAVGQVGDPADAAGAGHDPPAGWRRCRAARCGPARPVSRSVRPGRARTTRSAGVVSPVSCTVDPAAAGPPGRARVVELGDLPVGQPLPGGALGAVLRHAVAVPVAVPADRDPGGAGDVPRADAALAAAPAGAVSGQHERRRTSSAVQAGSRARRMGSSGLDRDGWCGCDESSHHASHRPRNVNLRTTVM